MELNYYIEYLKNSLTGFGLLETELDDSAWSKVVEAGMQEIQRYYDQTALISVSGSNCIDLAALENSEGIKISNIVKLYRTEAENGLMSNSTYVPCSTMGGTLVKSQTLDPMWIGFWQNNGSYNLQDYTYNIINYTTLQRLRNTMSTDLIFKEDPTARKLYINYSNGAPTSITIEYVPLLQNANQVTGSYWIDMLKRISLAIAKIAIGRIRTRYKQTSGSLWTDDGDTILAEGNNELKELRDRLQQNVDFIQPVD